MTTIGSYAQLAARIREAPGPVRLIGIDGFGGAGKTTFARRLTAVAGDVAVVQTDDFASHDEPLEWWPRFLADVVEPLSRQQPATYRPYDWVRRRLADHHITVAPRSVVLIEGVGATRKAWRDRLALGIWVEAGSQLRLCRGLDRDGEALADFWREWRRAEDRYLAEEEPMSHADLVVDGDPRIRHDAEREFVVVRTNGRPSAAAAPVRSR